MTPTSTQNIQPHQVQVDYGPYVLPYMATMEGLHACDRYYATAMKHGYAHGGLTGKRQWLERNLKWFWYAGEWREVLRVMRFQNDHVVMLAITGLRAPTQKFVLSTNELWETTAASTGQCYYNNRDEQTDK